jgi:dTDP-4-dehydrorhamnose 3,5-epimerase and related enzymes
MEFIIGEGEEAKAYYFPKGVLHGYRCIKGPMHIIYITSGVYDLTDEIRIADTDPVIGYDWTIGPTLEKRPQSSLSAI